MSVAGKLAEFFVNTSFQNLQPKVVEHAKIAIANTIASAAAGSQKRSVDIIRMQVAERKGSEESTVWFNSGPKIYVSDAARLNAMMSDAAAMDDSHMKCYAHPGTIAVSVALAAGERAKASGKDVLCAIVEGYEAAGRIGEQISPTFTEQRAMHNCIISVFAGTVAAAKLLRLNVKQMTYAIALSATSMGGLRIATNNITREYHAGLSAMQGINAVLAASYGYKADDNLLEAKAGYFETYGENVDIEAVTHGLGEDWDIVTDMALKLIPGVHGMHALVEAAINAARAGNVDPAEVERITVAGPPHLKGCMRHLHPRDYAGAIHSLPYYMAACIVDKEFSWGHVEMEKVMDPVIGGLQNRVVLQIEPGRSPADYPRGGTVTIRTKRGEEYADTVDWPKGSPWRGIEWSDVDAKYRALLPSSHLPEERIERSLQLLHELDTLRDISQLTAALAG